LAFVFWLGDALDAAGYATVPAHSIPELLSLTDNLELRVSLLVIDPAIAGAREYITDCRRSHPALKVIGIADDDFRRPRLRGLDATQARPANFDAKAIPAWIGCIEQVLGATRQASGRVS
jgi:hypothetical protein